MWCELGASECRLVWVRLWSLLLTGSSGGGPLEGIRASMEAPGWGGGGVVPLRPTSQMHIYLQAASKLVVAKGFMGMGE
jgi:hypothetical protein